MQKVHCQTVNLKSSDDIVIAFSDVPQGALGGVVLSVSKSSLEYWKEEQPAQTKAVQAFVGADIAGAVMGAANGAIGSYVVSGSVNWGSVGWGAATGAIIGSTGVVGKLGKWINKYLNKL